jgi:hypothetical protein
LRVTERIGRIFLVVIAATSLAALVAATIWRPDGLLPDDATALAKRVASDPTDWEAASALTEAALESDLAARVDLWRAAHEHALTLASRRRTPRESFVRSGFFHWNELTRRDQRNILVEATPMLRDPKNFGSMAPPLWQLTHNLSWLRSASGGDPGSLALLRDIAATNGLFADYRRLRDEAVARSIDAVNAASATAPSVDLLDHIPAPANTQQQPVFARVLEELHHHPIDKRIARSDAVDALIDYAIRHNLRPLDGLEYVVADNASATAPSRARLAVALGEVQHAAQIESSAGDAATAAWSDYYNERAAYERAHGDPMRAAGYEARATASRASRLKWSGTCAENEVCTSARREIVLDAPRSYTIAIARVASDETPPYVEIFIDEARIGEAPIAAEETFTTPPLPPGVHRVQVRIVNPFTRNLAQRRVRVLRESL